MSDTGPRLIVHINNASSRVVDEALIAGLLDFAYAKEFEKPACLDLLVADDEAIRALNRRHLGRDNATDVLAFEDGEDDPEENRMRLGDVAISAETAEREAEERSGAYAHELAFYALHGLYHLLGMDDALDMDRAAMLKKQADAMQAFGLDIGNALLGPTPK